MCGRSWRVVRGESLSVGFVSLCRHNFDKLGSMSSLRMIKHEDVCDCSQRSPTAFSALLSPIRQSRPQSNQLLFHPSTEYAIVSPSCFIVRSFRSGLVLDRDLRDRRSDHGCSQTSEAWPPSVLVPFRSCIVKCRNGKQLTAANSSVGRS